VADELAQRFNLPYWQMALTATDANRFAIRLARHLTGRQKILIFNWCYHGTVDETFVTLQNGVPTVRQGNIGAPIDPSLTTKVIEFNDIHALQAALADEDVACVLTEPALTNIGIVHPEPGFHAALRKITRATGTLLIIDETHTICAGPGGYTRAHGLEPDILTIGKPIAGGVPGACYGFTEAVADLMMEKLPLDTADTGGIGGTLAGNAFSLAAMRSTLETTLTQSAFDKMIPLATRFREGVEQTIEAHNLPWNVRQLGARVEYWFRQQPPRNGGEAAAAVDLDLDRFLHLAALNRGILMTPFHNMALMSPETTADQVDFHTAIFNELVMELTADE
jgi:glutamate-1-semialdehyde 2,1-aminomutase